MAQLFRRWNEGPLHSFLIGITADILDEQDELAPGALLDVVVGIDELQAEALGQAAADRGFSGAHRSDEHEVGGGIHGWRC